MRRFTTQLAVAVAGAALAAGTAGGSGGPDMKKLVGQGWECFPGDVMIHCVHPNTDIDALIAGSLPSVPSLNFSLGELRFLGTEILIRADLGDDGRPCNQGTEPLEQVGKRQVRTYEAVDFGGAPGPEYYSCHHNNEV